VACRRIAPPGPGAVLLDVGANVGTHSLALQSVAGQVLAIEPYPPVLERLREAIRRNHLTNVHAYELGYSDRAATLDFDPPPPDNLGLGSFENRLSAAPKMKLPLQPGDQHLAEIGATRVDAIKIDVEGYERPVVAGLTATIARNQPAVLIEMNGGAHGFESRADLQAAFPPGYVFAVMIPHDIVQIPLGLGRWVAGNCVTGAYRLEDLDVYPHGWNVVGVAARDRALIDAALLKASTRTWWSTCRSAHRWKRPRARDRQRSTAFVAGGKDRSASSARSSLPACTKSAAALAENRLRSAALR
jgi:FkbM family methyltransferase